MNFAQQYPVINMSLDLTENCSLRCKYCFAGDKQAKDIDEKVAFDALDWLAKPETSGSEKQLGVDFWGGEPLLRWDIAKELIKYGKKKEKQINKRFRWNMTTNGVNFTKQVATEIGLLGVEFMLSLDGDKETQDKNRPMPIPTLSSFDAVVRNLPYIKNVYGTVRIRMTLQEDDVPKLLHNYQFVHHELGIDQISHELAHETPWLKDVFEEYERQVMSIAQWYLEEKKKGNQRLWVKFIDGGLGEVLFPKRFNYFCGAGKSYVGVSVDGVIYPCHRFNDFGDKRPWREKEWSLGTVYDGLVFPERREPFIKSNDRQYCRQCPMYQKGICTGSCYAVNWIKNGDINIPARSWCEAMSIHRKALLSIYDELIRLPAYKPNLRKIAMRYFAPPPNCPAGGFNWTISEDEGKVFLENKALKMKMLTESVEQINVAIQNINSILQDEAERRLDEISKLLE